MKSERENLLMYYRKQLKKIVRNTPAKEFRENVNNLNIVFYRENDNGDYNSIFEGEYVGLYFSAHLPAYAYTIVNKYENQTKKSILQLIDYDFDNIS